MKKGFNNFTITTEEIDVILKSVPADKMDDISDDIVETGIMLGEKEKSLLNLNGVYASVPEGTNFSNEDVFQYVYNFFHALIDALIDCKSEVPGDVYSHFEEHIFYLRKEADYKIKHRLGSR